MYKVSSKCQQRNIKSRAQKETGELPKEGSSEEKRKFFYVIISSWSLLKDMPLSYIVK